MLTFLNQLELDGEVVNGYHEYLGDQSLESDVEPGEPCVAAVGQHSHGWVAQPGERQPKMMKRMAL